MQSQFPPSGKCNMYWWVLFNNPMHSALISARKSNFSLMQNPGNTFVIPPITVLCSLDNIRALVFSEHRLPLTAIWYTIPKQSYAWSHPQTVLCSISFKAIIWVVSCLSGLPIAFHWRLSWQCGQVYQFQPWLCVWFLQDPVMSETRDWTLIKLGRFLWFAAFAIIDGAAISYRYEDNGLAHRHPWKEWRFWLGLVCELFLKSN